MQKIAHMQLRSPLLAMGDGISSPVMQPGQKLELINGDLIGGDTELVIELADGSILGTHDGAVGNILGGVNLGWRHAVQRMRAARVGPYLKVYDNY